MLSTAGAARGCLRPASVARMVPGCQPGYCDNARLECRLLRCSPPREVKVRHEIQGGSGCTQCVPFLTSSSAPTGITSSRPWLCQRSRQLHETCRCQRNAKVLGMMLSALGRLRRTGSEEETLRRSGCDRGANGEVQLPMKPAIDSNRNQLGRQHSAQPPTDSPIDIQQRVRAGFRQSIRANIQYASAITAGILTSRILGQVPIGPPPEGGARAKDPRMARAFLGILSRL